MSAAIEKSPNVANCLMRFLPSVEMTNWVAESGLHHFLSFRIWSPPELQGSKVLRQELVAHVYPACL
jgi:hypothetical protein